MTALPQPATTAPVDRIVSVAIDGRITAEAITRLAASLDRAVDAAAPFAVLFDRRTMGAPTRDGRAELDRWGREDLPRLFGRCVAWADVYDERRAASIARAAAARDGGEDDSAGPYPQRVFTDPDEARRWLHHHLPAA